MHVAQLEQVRHERAFGQLLLLRGVVHELRGGSSLVAICDLSILASQESSLPIDDLPKWLAAVRSCTPGNRRLIRTSGATAVLHVIVDDYAEVWVNGELQQDSNTDDMIFNINEQIAYLSSHFTLWPGDVISTGTPSGVGRPRGLFLKPGDTVDTQA